MPTGIESWVEAWIEDVTGGVVTRAHRSFGGTTRITWLVDAQLSGTTVALVARVDPGSSAFTATPFSLHREAIVYRALATTTVPIPALVAEHPSGAALLIERRPGTADLRSLTPEGRADVLGQFVDHLAALHALDPATLDLPGLDRPVTAQEHATNDLDVWSALCPPDVSPEIAFAVGWLRSHAPAVVQRTSLLQGDTGPGNFVVDGGRITGIFDWELAHVGDPLDDLAWLVYRTTSPRGCPDVDMGRLLRRYEDASGLHVDPGALGYYNVFVHLRGAIATEAIVSTGRGTLGFAAYALEHQRFLRSLTLALGAAAGVDVTVEELAPAVTPRTALFERALDDLVTGVVPSLETSALRLRARESAILLDHLDRLDRFGPAIEAAERAERADLSAVADAGAAGDADVLAALLRRTGRRQQLWSDPLAC